MPNADRITLVDVLVNRKLSNTDSKTHNDMSAFYLSERKGTIGDQAPDREYYFARRDRVENPNSAIEVNAPGFNNEWDCIGTLVPNDSDSFNLDPFNFSSLGVSAFFETPTFRLTYAGLTKACKHHPDRHPLPHRPCNFIDPSNLYSLGEDTSKFVRRLFGEVPDQEDEDGMREMFNSLIIYQLLYTLDVSLMPGSAPWLGSMLEG